MGRVPPDNSKENKWPGKIGCPAYFVGNNMMGGCHQEDIMIRLAQADRDEFLATFDEASLFEPMKGRPMKEYVYVPESVQTDDQLFDQWLKRSHAYVSSLPPKEKKKGPKGKR